MKATSSSSSLDAARSRTTQPWRRAASWSRVSASIVTASGSTPLTSHRAAATRFPFSSAQTRSHRPGRSARVIGPVTANVIVAGASADIAGRSAAADRGDHVDPRMRRERGVERGALAVDVHVDVRPQSRTRLAEPVAQTGPALVEPVDRLVHGRRLDVEAARQLLEQRRKRRGQVQLGHGYATTATSTDEIAGR